MIRSTLPEAYVAAAATAFPRHEIGAADAADALVRLFPDEDEPRIRALVERSGVRRRFLAQDLAGVLRPGDFSARNARYQAAALELALRSSDAALRRAAVAPDEIDAVIDVSCTGVAIPAIDVPLAAGLGLRSDVRRIPITEAGCAAGGLALGLAADLARAGQTVLVTAVELCSFTLVPEDRSRTNLVACALFGDGAASAIVRPAGPGPRLVASGSRLIGGTRDVMGFDVGSHGMRIVLERALPGIVAAALPDAVRTFLSARGLSIEDVGLHLVHPGGQKILDAYESSFGLGGGGLVHSRSVLRDCGNLSSASILAVLERALLSEAPLADGRCALMVAIGPGLSIEMSLFEWRDVPVGRMQSVPGDVEVRS